MSLGRYSLIVLGVVGIPLGLLWPVLRAAEDPRAPWAALAGAGLAALNSLLAYCLVLFSIDRSNRVFLGAVLGGMLGRMVLLLGAVAAGIVLLDLPRAPFAGSLIGYFVLLLILELAILQRRTTPRSEPR